MRLHTLVILAVLPLAACSPPKLTSLDRTAGPPHTLVMVTGSDLGLSTVVWDAGTTGATDIPGGFLGAFMFSVPPTALPGLHNVAVRNAGGQSAIQQFNVATAAVPFPRPRIDSVTIVGAEFDTSGHVTASLYVQGANFDVGAVILIGGTAVATFTHKALRNDSYGVASSEFGYPIAHFASTAGMTGTRAVGETLSVTVRNLDMQTSDVARYKLPMGAATMDSDGDGLLDIWETNGYDANGDGVIDVNLPALGTDPNRRDILVELDVMPGLLNPIGDPAFNAARAMFSAAPFLNPRGDPGIKLILDTSGSVPYTQLVCFDLGTASGCADIPSLSTLKYSTLKAANFKNAQRDKIFHYAIWGAMQSSGDSGQSDFADDFLVTFDTWGTAFSEQPAFVQSVRSQVEELTHELGHDLGLHHGGGDDDDHFYLPNHWSVMTYTWDTRTGFSNLFRLGHATCLPFYYGTSGATESVLGAPPASPGTAVDYSSGMGKKLVRPVPSAPTVSMCGKAVNWTSDGNTGTIADVADWPILKFDGPVKNGWLVP